MTDAATAPAQEQPEAQPQPEMTREQVIKLIRENQQKDYDRNDHAERLRLCVRKSKSGQPWNNPLHGMDFENPSIVYTLDELRAFMPLERDRLSYSFEASKEGGTTGVLATNKHGLFSIGRPHGRRKPHMNLHQQAVKSESLRVFRNLLAERSAAIEAECKEQGIEYIGIPDALLGEIGKQAARIAIRNLKAKYGAYRFKANRVQQHSRFVNAGLLTIATSQRRFIRAGGQY